MRLIDADVLKATIVRNYRRQFFGSILWNILDDMPIIDAVPVVHGHFGFVGLGAMRVDITFGTCSNCKQRIGWYLHNNYCPNCGAKMDGGANK